MFLLLLFFFTSFSLSTELSLKANQLSKLGSCLSSVDKSQLDPDVQQQVSQLQHYCTNGTYPYHGCENGWGYCYGPLWWVFGFIVVVGLIALCVAGGFAIWYAQPTYYKPKHHHHHHHQHHHSGTSLSTTQGQNTYYKVVAT